MRAFRNVPLRQKLTWIIMLTSSTALLLAAVGFASYEWVTFRRRLVRDQSVLAQIIGANSKAALSFEDQGAAEETLLALGSEGHVLAACIYTKDGHVLAQYARAGASKFPAPDPAGDTYHFERDELVLFHRVTLDGEPIGTVYLRSDLGELSVRMHRYAGMAALFLITSSVVALGLSHRLQRVVSEPILRLAHLAHQVSLQKNYALRASKQGEDEIGTLIDGFNEMLEQIEHRDVALQHAFDLLEHRVEERTAELRAEIRHRRQAEREVQKLNRELERRVNQRTAELLAANRELAAFSYSVSHDLRTPLHTIGGYAQALQEDYGDRLDEDGRHYLDRLQVATQHMSQLIEDMLNLSRVTRGELHREMVNISEMARSIVDEIRSSQHGREVELRVDEGLCADADPRLTRVILENLLGNAWKFTSKHDRALIEVGALRQDTEPVFYVRDDGAGFNMDFAQKLFGAFQRLHSTSDFEGSGIGLATVQRIIHRHGGRVWAEGAVERGATFYFTFHGSESLGRRSGGDAQERRESHSAG